MAFSFIPAALTTLAIRDTPRMNMNKKEYPLIFIIKALVSDPVKRVCLNELHLSYRVFKSRKTTPQSL